MKDVPLSGSDSNHIVPPAVSTYRLTMERPSPIPDDLVVKLGVNILDFSSSGIPVPLSREPDLYLVKGCLNLNIYLSLSSCRNSLQCILQEIREDAVQMLPVSHYNCLADVSALQGYRTFSAFPNISREVFSWATTSTSAGSAPGNLAKYEKAVAIFDRLSIYSI